MSTFVGIDIGTTAGKGAVIRTAYRKIGVKDRAEATAWTRTHQLSSGAAT